ncbi:unnamed protein product [Hymenolepis diminuta]|uniref:Uncharacterized protein n=1 Tax=Hymenolepis diminuta TaxID=6216 RepID=A0A564XZS6_HYMDI|nr:unnamed protein product [Hymenolepis diminuta]
MFSRAHTHVAHIKPSLFSHLRQNARFPVTGSYTSLSSSLFLNTPLSLTRFHPCRGCLGYILV